MQSLLLVVTVVLFVGTSATTDFQCWNLKSTNDIRQIYLTNVNNLRKALAEGKQPSKNGNCPAGKNIYRLYWDCLLEQEAQKVVEMCSETATAPSELGMVIKKVPLTTCNPKPLFKQTVEGWWNQVTNQTVDQANPMSNENMKDFATLAYGQATRIGCAQKNCNGDLYMACMVYKKGPASGEPIYEVGAKCQNNNDCTTYEGSKCQTGTGLCLAGYPKNTTDTPTSPTTQATSPGATTTAGATTPSAGTTTQAVTTTAFPPDAASRICPGNEDISNDLIRTRFWNGTNEYRRNVAKGMAQAKHGIARPSCLMKKLTSYNCVNERTAHTIAARCLDEATSTMSNQNEFRIDNVNLVFQNAARRAVSTWYNEISTGTLEQGPGQRNSFSSTNGVTHLARMIWESHTNLGCAVAKCTGFLKVVCLYDKQIDMAGRQIYKMCPTCNRCPSACENGLCLA